MSTRSSLLVLGTTCLALGAHALVEADAPAVPAAPVQRAAAVAPRALPVRARTFTPPPVLAAPVAIVDEPAVADAEAHGLAPLTDPAAFAFVIDIGGIGYLRLADERAAARGPVHLVETDGMTAAVAPVALPALPAHLRAGAGRRVLVDGTCAATVVGFAELSRVAGGPREAYDDEGNFDPSARWSAADLVEQNVTLVAQLDDCTGTWARARDQAPAVVATRVDDPTLTALAEQALLADTDDTQARWLESGGTGDWRDAVTVETASWHDAATGDDWIIVQAHSDSGGCGEPDAARMAVYRATAGGAPRHVAELGRAYETVSAVVDVDGDGEPELLFGEGDDVSLVDLRGEEHASIYLPTSPYVDHGCGC